MPDHNPNSGDRLITLELGMKSLSKDVSDLSTFVKKEFEYYVRLERYRIVETAVFGLISLITTGVVGALLLIVLKKGI